MYKVETKAGVIIGYYDNRLAAAAAANAENGILFQMLQLTGWSEVIKRYGRYD